MREVVEVLFVAARRRRCSRSGAASPAPRGRSISTTTTTAARPTGKTKASDVHAAGRDDQGARFTLARVPRAADRNHPNLWAARARLACAHAQLDEAKWTPVLAVERRARRSACCRRSRARSSTPRAPRDRDSARLRRRLQPFVHVRHQRRRPALHVRQDRARPRRPPRRRCACSEWDIEKSRAADAHGRAARVLRAACSRATRSTSSTTSSRRSTTASTASRRSSRRATRRVDEIDKLRLEVYRDESSRGPARRQAASVRDRGAALPHRRADGFDIPDEPLKRPDVPLAPVVRYLGGGAPLPAGGQHGARRRRGAQGAGRSARAKLFPDIGVGLGGATRSRRASSQNTALAPNPFNHFYGVAGIGLRWSLDLLPATPRASRRPNPSSRRRARSSVSRSAASRSRSRTRTRRSSRRRTARSRGRAPSTAPSSRSRTCRTRSISAPRTRAR